MIKKLKYKVRRIEFEPPRENTGVKVFVFLMAALSLIFSYIFCATVSGEPIYSEPWSISWSKCSRCIGGHPRLRPIRSKFVLCAGHAMRRASSSVSAINPGE